MNWISLTDIAQLEDIYTSSFKNPVVIFKHSSRCSISSMVAHRLERAVSPANMDFYFLDVIKNRDISNIIAESYSVSHESPQVILISKGECIYDESHNGIHMDEIISQNTDNLV